MPSLLEVLQDTMLFRAAQTPPQTLGAAAPMVVPEPFPQLSTDPTIIANNPIWSWVHDPAHPAVVTNVQIKPRGMGVNYGHFMPVFTSVSLDEVQVETRNGGSLGPLPLSRDFVLQKHQIPSGHIAGNTTHPFWQLEANVDASMSIIFGYQLVGGSIRPLTQTDVSFLSDKLMPKAGSPADFLTGTVGQTITSILSPLRILVCFSLVCCKERGDFEPGELLGVGRIYPHVMVMASDDLERATVVISAQRPAKTATHGDPEMADDLSPILVADTNLPRHPFFLPFLQIIPLWDNMFDYYELSPLNNGVGDRRPLTVVDPKRKDIRQVSRAIKKVRQIPNSEGKGRLHAS